MRGCPVRARSKRTLQAFAKEMGRNHSPQIPEATRSGCTSCLQSAALPAAILEQTAGMGSLGLTHLPDHQLYPVGAMSVRHQKPPDSLQPMSRFDENRSLEIGGPDQGRA